MSSFYDIIGYPFGYIMSWIYDLVNNYSAAIILFTLVTKLIFFPINYHTQKNSARMQLLNPKLEKLKKSYKDNPTKLQEEQQKLYQQEGLNPMGSCLPSIMQMILLFGVLDVIYKPLTHILHFSKSVKNAALEIASGMVEDGIKSSDLRNELRIMEQLNNDPDKFSGVGENFKELVQQFSENFTFLGANLGQTPTFHHDSWTSEAVILLLIPFIAGLAQLVQTVYTQVYQKRTNPNAQRMGCMNVMLYLMPVLSVWFAFQVPAGVGFYWAWSSIFSFLITLGLNIYFTPKRIAAVNEKNKEKAKKKAAKHPERKSFMQKMIEQQQLLEQQQKGGASAGNNGDGKISRSEMNKYNRDVIKEARKRMAEKYGDVYDENNDNDEE
ncbi:MAG: YidC/Oxa1 family membrane protein insertase [Ruminococcus sp.]|nr:YidC/Oxa1 family membrane protein insertase [Ruminococcus sp.]